jgi:hypothetical protein
MFSLGRGEKPMDDSSPQKEGSQAQAKFNHRLEQAAVFGYLFFACLPALIPEK